MRLATPEDMVGVMALIQELADYENMSDAPRIDDHSMYWRGSPQDEMSVFTAICLAIPP